MNLFADISLHFIRHEFTIHRHYIWYISNAFLSTNVYC